MGSFDEMFEKGDDKFCIFADDADIFGGFDGDGLVLIATFIESYRDLTVNIVSDCHFALASIPFTSRLARNELVHS